MCASRRRAHGLGMVPESGPARGEAVSRRRGERSRAGTYGLRCGMRSRKAASSILSRISLLTGLTTGMERRSAASTVRGTWQAGQSPSAPTPHRLHVPPRTFVRVALTLALGDERRASAGGGGNSEVIGVTCIAPCARALHQITGLMARAMGSPPTCE